MEKSVSVLRGARYLAYHLYSPLDMLFLRVGRIAES